MSPAVYIVTTALQSVIVFMFFYAYRGAARLAQEIEKERDDYREKYRKAEDERHRAVMDRIYNISRTTSQEEVARAVETLAAALTPRAGAAEACAKADKRPAPRPRRR